MSRRLSIAILGLSITSSWGNGHATTFRALVRELHAAGHHVLFLEPGREILLASDGAEVAGHVEALNEPRARAIGEAARRRVLAEHTYDHRALEVEALLEGRDGLREAV